MFTGGVCYNKRVAVIPLDICYFCLAQAKSRLKEQLTNKTDQPQSTRIRKCVGVQCVRFVLRTKLSNVSRRLEQQQES
eukprot:4876932-Amphidinium_carterae.5